MTQSGRPGGRRSRSGLLGDLGGREVLDLRGSRLALDELDPVLAVDPAHVALAAVGDDLAVAGLEPPAELPLAILVEFRRRPWDVPRSVGKGSSRAGPVRRLTLLDHDVSPHPDQVRPDPGAMVSRRRPERVGLESDPVHPGAWRSARPGRIAGQGSRSGLKTRARAESRIDRLATRDRGETEGFGDLR